MEGCQQGCLSIQGVCQVCLSSFLKLTQWLTEIHNISIFIQRSQEVAPWVASTASITPRSNTITPWLHQQQRGNYWHYLSFTWIYIIKNIYINWLYNYHCKMNSPQSSLHCIYSMFCLLFSYYLAMKSFFLY